MLKAFLVWMVHLFIFIVFYWSDGTPFIITFVCVNVILMGVSYKAIYLFFKGYMEHPL